MVTKEEAVRIKELIGLYPELKPLTEEQKEGFLKLWGEYKTYKARQKIVDEIPDLYGNRKRYMELLEGEDREMFNDICRDENTRF